MLVGCLLVFFDRWPAATRQTHAVGWSILQLGIEFSSATTDGIYMHSCDLGHQGRTTMSQLLGLQGYIPAALLLIQATEQQVHLMVQLPIWMVTRLLATWTLALMYYRLC
jgi:hypothetical protein